METPTYSSMSARVSRKWDLFLCSASCDGYLPWEAVGKGFLRATAIGAGCVLAGGRVLQAGRASCLACPSVPLRAREGVYSDA